MLKALGGCSSHHLQEAGHIVEAPLQAAQLLFVRDGPVPSLCQPVTLIDYKYAYPN